VAIFEKKGIKIFPLSAATGEGTKAILNELIRILTTSNKS